MRGEQLVGTLLSRAVFLRRWTEKVRRGAALDRSREDESENSELEERRMAGDGQVEGVGGHYIALWSIPFFRHLLVNVIGRLIQKVGTS